MTEQEKIRSQLLKKQLKQMADDFISMKRSKELWRNQLQARFQAIDRQQHVLYAGIQQIDTQVITSSKNSRIEASKTFIASQAKRTNDTLLAFQYKFEEKVSETKRNLQTQMQSAQNQTQLKLDQHTENIMEVNKKVQKESIARKSQFDEASRNAKECFLKQQQNLQKEVAARKKNESDNMTKISQSLRGLQEQLDSEKQERSAKLATLSADSEGELTAQRQINDKFHGKCEAEYSQSLLQLKHQMENRFKSKDQIIEAISKVVKTLQDTLRHPH